MLYPCLPFLVQAYEDATGKTSSANKEAFRAAMVRLLAARLEGGRVDSGFATQPGLKGSTYTPHVPRAARGGSLPLPCCQHATGAGCTPPPHQSPPPRPALQLNALERRLFFIPSFKIYGSVAGFYDYGPPGCAMKQNVTQTWRNHFVLEVGAG